MILLGVDTTSDRLSVAATDGQGRRAGRSLAGARQHAKALVPLVADALAELGLRVEDVEGLALSDGPGSFTGLRVGAAFAKAVARARGVPLWTACTLLVRAWQGRGLAPAGGAVAGVGRALRGELYVGLYRFGSGHRVETLLTPTVLRPGAVLPDVPAVALVVGDLEAPTVGEWPWARSARWVGPPDGLPLATTLLEVVAAGRARRIEGPADWEPTYGRPAEAQAKWELAHGRALVDPASRR